MHELIKRKDFERWRPIFEGMVVATLKCCSCSVGKVTDERLAQILDAYPAGVDFPVCTYYKEVWEYQSHHIIYSH